MVGGARGLEPDEVKQILKRIKESHGQDKEYLQLRSRLPADFPL